MEGEKKRKSWEWNSFIISLTCILVQELKRTCVSLQQQQLVNREVYEIMSNRSKGATKKKEKISLS